MLLMCNKYHCDPSKTVEVVYFTRLFTQDKLTNHNYGDSFKQGCNYFKITNGFIHCEVLLGQYNLPKQPH